MKQKEVNAEKDQEYTTTQVENQANNDSAFYDNVEKLKTTDNRK